MKFEMLNHSKADNGVNEMSMSNTGTYILNNSNFSKPSALAMVDEESR